MDAFIVLCAFTGTAVATAVTVSGLKALLTKKYKTQLEDQFRAKYEVACKKMAKEHDQWKKEYDAQAQKQQAELWRSLVEDSRQDYPWMAQQFADFLYWQDAKVAGFLKVKWHPAPVAAENVMLLAEEKKILQKQLKCAQYQLDFYESMFPRLKEFKELEPLKAADLVLKKELDDKRSSDPNSFAALLGDKQFNLKRPFIDVTAANGSIIHVPFHEIEHWFSTGDIDRIDELVKAYQKKSEEHRTMSPNRRPDYISEEDWQDILRER